MQSFPQWHPLVLVHPLSHSLHVSAAVSSPRQQMSVLTSSVKSRQVFRKMTRETQQLSQTMSVTTSVMSQEWAQTYSSPTSVPSLQQWHSEEQQHYSQQPPSVRLSMHSHSSSFRCSSLHSVSLQQSLELCSSEPPRTNPLQFTRHSTPEPSLQSSFPSLEPMHSPASSSTATSP